MAESSTKDKVHYDYGIVANIPECFHSADLRNYFSQFIEAKGFNCFHFRHRPETKGPENDDSIPQLHPSSTNGQSARNHARLSAGVDIEDADRTHLTSTEIQTQLPGPGPGQGQGGNDTDDTAASAASKLARPKLKVKTFCCVVRLEKTMMNKFIQMYHKKPWIDKKGSLMSSRCFISRIQVEDQTTDEDGEYRTRGESKVIPPDRETFTESHLNRLAELNPPDLMPNGNVGTPTAVFQEYIRTCRLPPKIIQKLGLTFSKSRTNKRYGSVPFAYGGDVVEGVGGSEETVVTAAGHEIAEDRGGSGSRGAGKPRNVDGSGGKREGQGKGKTRMKGKNNDKTQDSESDEDDDDDTCEEWERHESLHEDITSQERIKERLFEEKIELKWEKGGSGLVFYTDAAFWDAQEGDFDEKTSDDWDVDMSIYYDEHGGDKDARDFITMRRMERMKRGLEDTSVFNRSHDCNGKRSHDSATQGSHDTIGKFEKHTKGIGRKVMEKQGWCEGSGLGKTKEGMAEALDNSGQHTRDKTGFGFHGEKLQRGTRGRGGKKRRVGQREREGVIISTIYDNPSETDPLEPLMRSRGPHHLKYRHEIDFVKGDRTDDIVKR